MDTPSQERAVYNETVSLIAGVTKISLETMAELGQGIGFRPTSISDIRRRKKELGLKNPALGEASNYYRRCRR
jgi:hypothetical protein